MIATPSDLKKLGLDETLFQVDSSSIDSVLEEYLFAAEVRIRNWVGDSIYEEAKAENGIMNKRFARAEASLAIVEALPDLWASMSVGESDLEVEGLKVQLVATGVQDKQNNVQSLLAKAERLLSIWLPNPNEIDEVKLRT